ncbi:hypothetical protein TNCV_2257971 [Trichonephila clavipes]|nr:hypothetical protein TNCV_2257971 [Trichonephila clavipes]
MNTCNYIKLEKCRINIKFLVKKSDTKTFQIVTETYGKETLSRAHEFEWYQKFLEEGDSVQEEERAGLPRPEVGSDGWLLHEDKYTRSHGPLCLAVSDQKNITVMGHLPYLPDLVSSDFFISYN